MARRLSRKTALLAMYSFSMRGETEAKNCQPVRKTDWEDEVIALEAEDLEFSQNLYYKTINSLDEIDNIIKEYSMNWDIERISIIDKNIIRLALSELLFFPEISGRVTINEAIELSKEYGGEDSPRFINGILDAVMRKINIDIED